MTRDHPKLLAEMIQLLSDELQRVQDEAQQLRDNSHRLPSRVSRVDRANITPQKEDNLNLQYCQSYPEGTYMVTARELYALQEENLRMKSKIEDAKTSLNASHCTETKPKVKLYLYLLLRPNHLKMLSVGSGEV